VQLLGLLVLSAALLVCVVLGANNASACVRTSTGILSVEYSTLAIVGGLGVVFGSVIEGGKLSNAIYGGVLATQNDKTTIIILVATLVVMLVATILKLPLSLTQAMVGTALPMGLLETGVNWRFLTLVGGSWVATPLVAATLSIVIYRIVKRTGGRIGNIFQRARMYAAITVVASLYVGYALGANGVGLIYGIARFLVGTVPFLSLCLSIAAVAGIYLFGYTVTSTVSEKILALAGAAALAAQVSGALTVHFFTQIGIPVSITQAVVGGIVGIGQAKAIVIMNRRMVLRVVFGWIMAPLTGLVLAWLLLISM